MYVCVCVCVGVCVCVCVCVCVYIYIYIYIYIYTDVYEDDYNVILWGTDLNFVHLEQVALQSGWHHRHLYTKDVVRSMASPKRNTHYM